jgi:hypothetical protein
MVDRQTVTAARDDVALFADALIGQPLWGHQVEAARSEARIRCVCSGRQAGKTRLLAMLALHEAFRTRRRRVLVVSAVDDAARALLAEVSMLAQAPALSISVTFDGQRLLTLSNGSTIRSVPASERQIRGHAVDLLIVDEACFVDEAIWNAARWTMIARPGSKVVLSSTPWGRRDRFFSLLYRAGLAGAAGHASFHWPSTVSPLVDVELLEMWRETSTSREYESEVLAVWTDEAGAYFTSDELEAAVCDYDLVPPDEAHGRTANAGIDWGFSHDSSALVLLALAGPEDLPGEWPVRTFWLPWVHEAVRTPYSVFVAEVAACAAGYKLARVASECNGVGMMPTQELTRLLSGKVGRVVEVTTTATSKEDGFGAIKLLLQQGRLALPRHPRLLQQLSALEYEQRDSGTTKISVPERMGNDDLAMACCLVVGETDTSSKSMAASVRAARGRMPKTKIGRSTGDASFHPGAGGVPSWLKGRRRGLIIQPGQYRPPEER